VADLGTLRALPGSHILEHALTQRRDGSSVGHGELHPE
jgi:hypothetical protein